MQIMDYALSILVQIPLVKVSGLNFFSYLLNFSSLKMYSSLENVLHKKTGSRTLKANVKLTFCSE